MPRLHPDDRERLRLISEAGGKLDVVTHSRGKPDTIGAALAQWAYGMCDDDYMRLEKITGDPHDRSRDRVHHFFLTAKAERAAKRGV